MIVIGLPDLPQMNTDLPCSTSEQYFPANHNSGLMNELINEKENEEETNKNINENENEMKKLLL